MRIKPIPYHQSCSLDFSMKLHQTQAEAGLSVSDLVLVLALTLSLYPLDLYSYGQISSVKRKEYVPSQTYTLPYLK